MLEMQKEVEKMRVDAKRKMLKLLTEKQKNCSTNLRIKRIQRTAIAMVVYSCFAVNKMRPHPVIW
jgi:hypothetical protein